MSRHVAGHAKVIIARSFCCHFRIMYKMEVAEILYFQSFGIKLHFYSLGIHSRRKYGRFPKEGSARLTALGHPIGTSSSPVGRGFPKGNGVSLGRGISRGQRPPWHMILLAKSSVLYLLRSLTLERGCPHARQTVFSGSRTDGFFGCKIHKCLICGAGMYGNKSIKHKQDGTKYKDFFYYGCKHRTMTHGHKCDYRKQIHEELLDSAVAEAIVKLVSNPKFAAMMQEKINMKVDTAAIEQEIANYEKQLRQYYAVKAKLMEEIDSLDPDDKHYYKRKADLDDRLYKMYDKTEDTENLLITARAKKMAIKAEKLTGDNIYKVLIYFDKLYAVMSEQEKR